MSDFDGADPRQHAPRDDADDRPDTGQDSAGRDNVIVARNPDGSQVAVVDANQDGDADREAGITVAVDRDGDGVPEVVYSQEHGGPGFDTATYDVDGDGVADAIATDRNRDGRFDELALDRDGDGKIDMILLDEDFDGHPDRVRAAPGAAAPHEAAAPGAAAPQEAADGPPPADPAGSR